MDLGKNIDINIGIVILWQKGKDSMNYSLVIYIFTKYFDQT